MKIIISSAKLMSLKSDVAWKHHSRPHFLKQAEILNEALKEYSPAGLEGLLDISPQLAARSWERNREWKPDPPKGDYLQALLTFKGEMYRGIDAETLTEKPLNYLQDNLFIISGFYGILSPYDDITLYRLEMDKKLKTKHANNLYQFWGNSLVDYINTKMDSEEPVLNLASKAYSKAVNSKQLKGPLIHVSFKDYKNGKLKSIMVYFKHARGKMVRWCAKNQITDIKDIKVFNEDGYEFSQKLSSKEELVFIR